MCCCVIVLLILLSGVNGNGGSSLSPQRMCSLFCSISGRYNVPVTIKSLYDSKNVTFQIWKVFSERPTLFLTVTSNVSTNHADFSSASIRPIGRDIGSKWSAWKLLIETNQIVEAISEGLMKWRRDLILPTTYSAPSVLFIDNIMTFGDDNSTFGARRH